MEDTNISATPPTVNNHVSVTNEIQLDLVIKDRTVINFLSQYNDEQRKEKALEALKVGVIAIQSASPFLDTKVVEEKFQDVHGTISECISNFADDLKSKLEEHFKPDSGSLPRSIDKAFGEQGTVSKLFDDYFGPETGKVMTLLQKQIGPGSDFSNSLDPKNQGSVIYLIQTKVKEELDNKLKTVLEEFSLDKDGSAITRLKTCVEDEVKKIQKDNQEFFEKLGKALGVQLGSEIEAQRGTQKGRDFEADLYKHVAELGRQLGDSTANVCGSPGLKKNNKKGDYVITLGDTSGAPGKKIVIEAKNDKSYKLRDAIEELKEAKKNRGAQAGIFAFEAACSTPEIGNFHRIGEDFFVVVNEAALDQDKPPIYLEAAYKICRTLLITSYRAARAEELDVVQIQNEIIQLIEHVKQITEMEKKAKTINNSSEEILKLAEKLKEEFDSRLNNVLGLLRVAIQESPETGEDENNIEGEEEGKVLGGN